MKDLDVRWQVFQQDVLDWAIRGEFGVRGPELDDIFDKHRPLIEGTTCLHDGIEDASDCERAL